MPAPLRDIVAFLDGYLRPREIPDEANALNGLQLEACTDVDAIACAVDADASTIDRAVDGGAQLLLVHHGLFWSGHRPIIGAYGAKLRRALASGLSVYGAHIPLDVHPESGNNAGLVRALGLTPDGTFGRYQGIEIGLTASCDLAIDELVERLGRAVAPGAPARSVVRVLGRGPARVWRLGVCTGGGASYLGAAARAGLDALITGEGAHYTALDAEELGLHLLMAGHYRTETFGVKAVAEILAQRFGLRWFFVEHDTGL